MPQQDVQAAVADLEDHGQRLVPEPLALRGPGRLALRRLGRLAARGLCGRPFPLGMLVCSSPRSLRLISWHVRIVLSTSFLLLVEKCFILRVENILPKGRADRDEY